MTRPTGHITYDNTGRVVVVTGGACGIGRAVCEQFARSGAQVVALDINREAAASLPAGIRFQECDTADEESCRKAVEWTVAETGALDILVNNAAIQPKASYTPLDQLDSALAKRIVDVNFMGYTFMAKYAVRVMQQQGSGVIVNIGSGQGHRTAREVPIYGPIKAATILQSMQWGIEYARQGIRVVSVSPGAIDTPLVRASLEAQGGGEALAHRHPLGRIGQPEEIAYAVMWLAGPDASFITATDLSVDGGLSGYGAFADPYPTKL